MEEKKLSFPSVEQLEQELKKEKYKKSYWKTFRSTVYLIIVVVAVAVILSMLILPVMRISGSSMADTLMDKDIVVAVNDHKYKTGDIIGFYYNNNVLIKRVIAVSGDWVDIDEEGNVFVNGIKLDEPYITDRSKGECTIKLPYQVPEGRCFVMGDHRSVSIDSRNREMGCISDEFIIGRLIFRIWPIAGIGLIK